MADYLPGFCIKVVKLFLDSRFNGIMSLITLFYRSIYTITDYKSSGRKGAQAKDEEVLVMEKVSGQKRKSRLRGWVFWPPFLVLLMVLILGFVSQDAF